MPGDVFEKGETIDFKTDKFFYMIGPVKFFTTFGNRGNIHLVPEGEIAVENFFGARVAQIPLKSWTVLPNSDRTWEAQWNRKWLLGRYTAELTLQHGTKDGKVDKREVVFWAFPWHIALLILAILILTYYFLRWVGEHLEVKKKNKNIDDRI